MDTIERRFTHDGRARVLSRPSTTPPPPPPPLPTLWSWSTPDTLFPPSSAGRKRGLTLSNVDLRGRRIGARSLFGRVSNAPSSGEDASGGGCAAREVYGRGGNGGGSAVRSKVGALFERVAGRCESGRPRARPAEDRPTTVAEAHSVGTVFMLPGCYSARLQLQGTGRRRLVTAWVVVIMAWRRQRARAASEGCRRAAEGSEQFRSERREEAAVIRRRQLRWPGRDRGGLRSTRYREGGRWVGSTATVWAIDGRDSLVSESARCSVQRV